MLGLSVLSCRMGFWGHTWQQMLARGWGMGWPG